MGLGPKSKQPLRKGIARCEGWEEARLSSGWAFRVGDADPSAQASGPVLRGLGFEQGQDRVLLLLFGPAPSRAHILPGSSRLLQASACDPKPAPPSPRQGPASSSTVQRCSGGPRQALPAQAPCGPGKRCPSMQWTQASGARSGRQIRPHSSYSVVPGAPQCQTRDCPGALVSCPAIPSWSCHCLGFLRKGSAQVYIGQWLKVTTRVRTWLCWCGVSGLQCHGWEGQAGPRKVGISQ